MVALRVIVCVSLNGDMIYRVVSDHFNITVGTLLRAKVHNSCKTKYALLDSATVSKVC